MKYTEEGVWRVTIRVLRARACRSSSNPYSLGVLRFKQREERRGESFVTTRIFLFGGGGGGGRGKNKKVQSCSSSYRGADVASPLRAEVAEIAGARETDVVERRLADDADGILGHHRLTGENLKQRRLARAVGAGQEAARTGRKLEAEVRQDLVAAGVSVLQRTNHHRTRVLLAFLGHGCHLLSFRLLYRCYLAATVVVGAL